MLQVIILLTSWIMLAGRAIALNVKPKRAAREFMDLRFVNDVVAELLK